MTPLTLLTAQKLASLLTNDNALATQINTLAAASGMQVPGISAGQIAISSASPDMGDKNIQLTYPRVCLYSSALKNTRTEKFKSVSGTVAVIAEVWASGNMVTQTDQWIHFYVEAFSGVLLQNTGDWGNGVFFSGVYDVQFQPPKAGGLGFVQAAKITCTLNVSVN